MKIHLTRLIAVFFFCLLSFPVFAITQSSAYSSCHNVAISHPSSWWGGNVDCFLDSRSQSYSGSDHTYVIYIIDSTGTSGRYFNQGSWYWDTTCALPQVWSDITHSCGTAPCIVGQTQQIAVKIAENTPDNVMTIYVNGASNQSTATACFNGCVYNYNTLSPLNSNDGCLSDPSDPAKKCFSNYQATSTANSCSGSSAGQGRASAPIPAATTNVSVKKTDGLNCIKDKTGKELCSDPVNPGEGTINGAKFKLKDGVDCQSVDGFAEPLCAGFAKNCGRVNGKMVCVETNPPPSGTTPYDVSKEPKVVCKEDVLGFVHCMADESGVKSSQTQSVQTMPNGDVVTTTITTNNIQGDGQKVTTTTVKPDGTSTTSTQGDPSAADNGTGNTEVGNGNTSGLDGVFSSLTNSLGGSQITGNDYITPFWTLPAVGTCQTISMHFKALNYTLDPCAKLSIFRAMFGWLLYIITGYFIFQIAIGKH